MSTIEIRPGRVGDIAQIFAVHRDSVTALYTTHYTEAQIRDWLSGRSAEMYLPAIEGGRLWVAEDGGVIGFAEIDGTELTKLFVRGDRSRRGVGRALLHTALEAIRRSGASSAVLEATTNARAFYAQQGFVETGRGEFSHGAGGEPLEIVKMQLALQP